MDIFRGSGILLMVMGHVVGNSNRFSHFIHAFHMPMFFFISGYFFLNVQNEIVSPKEFIKKKCKSLIVPYCIFGIFHFIFWYIKYWDLRSIEPLLNLLFINTKGLPVAGALWFLTALFFSNVIYFFIIYYIKSHIIKNLIIIIVALVGNIATDIYPFRMPYALDASFVGVGMIHIAQLIRQYENKRGINCLLNLHWLNCIISGSIITILIFFNGCINMRNGEYAIVPLFWINAVGAILVGINLSKYILYLKEKSGCITFFADQLIEIGKNSIVYVCLNEVVILLVSERLSLINFSGRWFSLSLFTISLCILRVVDVMLRNDRFRIVLGKSTKI